VSKKIITVITDALGDRVVVCENEFLHAIEDHFPEFPQDLVLQLLEKVLRDPTEVYRDDSSTEQIYNFFYKADISQKFVVAVIKVTSDGAFFASMYPTGKKVRNSHKTFKKVKL
jgi:hypothetical protein